MFNGYKTYIGAGVALASTLARMLGYEVAPVFEAQATELALDLITAAGALFAIYGRAKVQTPGWFSKKQ